MKIRRVLFGIINIIICITLQESLISQSKGAAISLDSKMGIINGTLMLPEVSPKPHVALIIAGSGPTDRDGNNPARTNNSLKIIAEELYKNGIASVRYDKRGIGESKAAAVAERNLRFEDYINDATSWILMLKKDARFSKVIVVGHSEGSLIGLVASRLATADAFISAAGAGKTADKIIKEQLSVQPESVTSIAFPILDSLVLGKKVNNVHPMLNPLFRESIQPYVISWIKYDPSKEIAKLKIPTLIIQGTTDLQITVEDAELLSKANPKAKLVTIDGMNHIFREASLDRQANFATYKNPGLPVVPEFLESITQFIIGIK